MYSHRRKPRYIFCIYQSLICLILLLFCLPAIVHAQQPTAAITAITGDVMVSMQGAAFQTATVGDSLHAGDIIETGVGAGVVLLLSDGSELRLGQNTKIDITALTERPETKARVSRISLLYGKIRAVLSPGHQKKDSSFHVDTPNAMVGVKFSQPIIEASYDPTTQTSVFTAYTTALEVTNHITHEIKEVPQGNQVVIREDLILLSPLPPGSVPASGEPLDEDEAAEPEAAPETSGETPPGNQQDVSTPESKVQSAALPATSQAPTRAGLMKQARSAARGTTSTTVPVSVGAVGTGETDSPPPEEGSGTTDDSGGSGGTEGTTSTETSTNPSPGSRPDATIRPRPITITINED